MLHRISTVLAALLVFAVSAAPALAAAPGNDDIGSPIVIESIPYTNGQDTTEATPGPTDPHCFGTGPTVWYAYTAENDGWLAADTLGSDYDTTLTVGTPDGEGGLDVIACNDDYDSLQSRVVFVASAGVTYLFMIGAYASGPGGELVFNLDESGPPPPPPPPFDLSVTVNPKGTFHRDGSATISGTLSCGGEGYLELYATLSQRVGRFTILGFGGTFTECSETAMPWIFDIAGITGAYSGGNATVSVFAWACSAHEDSCGFVELDQRIRLRR